MSLGESHTFSLLLPRHVVSTYSMCLYKPTCRYTPIQTKKRTTICLLLWFVSHWICMGTRPLSCIPNDKLTPHANHLLGSHHDNQTCLHMSPEWLNSACKLIKRPVSSLSQQMQSCCLGAAMNAGDRLSRGKNIDLCPLYDDLDGWISRKLSRTWPGCISIMKITNQNCYFAL